MQDTNLALTSTQPPTTTLSPFVTSFQIQYKFVYHHHNFLKSENKN